MNSTFEKMLIFVMGAAVGSAITWKLIKTKYEQIAQEEIDSVKERYSKKESVKPKKEKAAPDEESTVSKGNKEVAEYAKKLHDLGYTDYTTKSDKSENVSVSGDKPYVITPESFGEFDDYRTESLYYYTDGVLADVDDDIFEDVHEHIGSDFASYFGEHEQDAVHIRNDKLKIDYEILMSQKAYSEVAGNSPI